MPASQAEGKLLSQSHPFADVLVATINHTTLPELWTLADALPFGSIPRRLFKVGSCGARPQRQQLGRCGGRSAHRHVVLVWGVGVNSILKPPVDNERLPTAFPHRSVEMSVATPAFPAST